MKLVIKQRAESDVARIWHYIAQQNPDAANRLLDAAYGTFELIAERPAAGSQRTFRRIAGIRSRSIIGFEKYLIFYREKSNKVEILRVIHGMRNLPQFFRP